MSNSWIWPIDRTLSDATSPSQSEAGSNGYKVVFCISLNSRIAGALPSDSLWSYAGHSFRGLTTLQRCNRCILQFQPTGLLSELFNSKAIFEEKQLWFYLTQIWGSVKRSLYLSPKGISLRVNVKTWVEFERIYYDVTVYAQVFVHVLC